MLFAPFAVMDVRIGEVVWAVLNVLALGLVSWIALDMMLISSGRRRLVLAVVTTAGCTLLDSVLSNLIFGQICVFLMLLVLIDIQPWMPRWLCGIATGIAATLKLTPLMFVVYLFFIGRRRGAFQAIATFVATLLISLLVLPYDSKQYWFAGDFIKLSRIVTATDVQHSLSGFCARLNGDAIVPPLWTWPICAVVAIFGFVVAIIAVRRGHNLLGALIIGFTAALVSPVSWSYDYVWIAPALIWLVTANWRSKTILPRILFPIIVLWSIVPFYWSGNRVGLTPAYQVTLKGNLIATLGSPMMMVFLALATLPLWLPELLPPDQKLNLQT
jgi:alpha-1,2-mannosyltransferase